MITDVNIKKKKTIPWGKLKLRSPFKEIDLNQCDISIHVKLGYKWYPYVLNMCFIVVNLCNVEYLRGSAVLAII